MDTTETTNSRPPFAPYGRNDENVKAGPSSLRVKFNRDGKTVSESFGVSVERLETLQLLMEKAKIEAQLSGNGGGHFDSKALLQRYSEIPESTNEAIYIGYNAGRVIERTAVEENPLADLLSQIFSQKR